MPRTRMHPGQGKGEIQGSVSLSTMMLSVP